MPRNRERLDKLLVEKGIFESRNKARRAIMAGEIRVDGQLVDKAGTQVSVDADIRFTGDRCPYVSRGGLKLEKALKSFAIDVEGKLVIDVGASTGGFTDCLLQHGARQVYAVDVGYGQLAWKLRQDPRVKVMERYNFRYAEPEDFGLKFQIATIDVSFISLEKIFRPLVNLLETGGEVVSLIKPQFEAGPEKVGKRGVVKDPGVHEEVLCSVIVVAAGLKLELRGLSFSPIPGAQEGNIEFLAYFIYKGEENQVPEINKHIDKIRAVVQEAHSTLK